MASEVYVDGQRMSRSNCMGVHSHLDQFAVCIWHKGLFRPEFFIFRFTGYFLNSCYWEVGIKIIKNVKKLGSMK